MSRLVSVLAALLLLAFGLACGGLADLDLEGEPPPSAAWVGHWEGPGMEVVIEPEGFLLMERDEGGIATNLAGPTQSWTDEGVLVGVPPFATTLKVDERPYESDGTWRMVLDGVPLVRVDEGGADPSEPVEPAGLAETDPSLDGGAE